MCERKAATTDSETLSRRASQPPAASRLNDGDWVNISGESNSPVLERLNKGLMSVEGVEGASDPLPTPSRPPAACPSTYA
eukprot:173347-Prorocentrum_minimum.AAC.1